MREIEAEHLIVGGGLLGLALADHLLRRDASGVVVLERSGESPGRRAAATPGLALRTGRDEYRPLEDRALLLLEEWKGYLGSDPGYRRSGSWSLPAAPGSETLGGDVVSSRTSGMVVGPDAAASFEPDDGVLDLLELTSSLFAGIRDRQGELLLDAEVRRIAADEDGFTFEAGSRRGRARRVYLTDGLASIRLLHQLGVSTTLRVDTWHWFHLDTEPSEALIVRLGADDAALICVRSDEGELHLLCRAEPGPFRPECPVDWQLLEASRNEHHALLPELKTARISRGRGEHLVSLDAAPGFISALGGRLLASGAFGPYGLLLSIALGEHLAERGLDLPLTVPTT